MADPNSPFIEAYKEAEKLQVQNGAPIRIYSIEAGEDEIVDTPKLKKNKNVSAVAIYRIKSISRFELMDI